MTDTRFHDAMNWSCLPNRSNGWGNRYFIDTEFSDFQTPEVLSIAIVGENGFEFYGERTDYSETWCSDFVRAVVIPQFGRFERRAMILERLSEELRDWFTDIPAASKPVLCYDDVLDIDMLRVLLNGPLPGAWAFTNISGQLDSARRAAYFLRHGGEHHALHDARANAYAYGF
ncbi:3'-5' exoribonuclease [Cupriavidus sp. 2SB]|uniref:3'-5' exoribonuclease n=1 Tax=Cupriavidus sp. 2SB TaxID=2502199 RepID=UPI0010F8B213|nr:3'-5' exoribonuclease [Cupriavidus sp. 2SB]